MSLNKTHVEELIETVKQREAVRFANTLLIKYDLKRVLQEKFPDSKIAVSFNSLKEQIDEARRWNGEVNHDVSL